MNKLMNFKALGRMATILVLSAFVLVLSGPAEVSAAEGKKGLNAVNVKVLSRDDSKPMGEWVQANIVGREMVMPGDNVLCIDGAKIIIDRDTGRIAGHDDDCDGIPEERGDKVIQIIKGIRNTGHINVLRFVGAGTVAEIIKLMDAGAFPKDWTLPAVANVPELEPIEIELRMTKGTVKFFDETKSFGRAVIDILNNMRDR